MHVQIIIVPYDTARRDWRSGAGPEHLLRAGLAADLADKGHTVAEIQVIESDPEQPPAEIATGFELMRKVAVAVRAAREGGRFPLVLSGNCNASVGALSGLTPARRALFWFDAHGDLNTPDTTTSGFLDGTGLATALGLCWHRLAAGIPGFQQVEPEATFLLGARDLDPPEAALVDRERSPRSRPTESPSSCLGSWTGHRSTEPSATCTWISTHSTRRSGRANTLPVPDGLSVEQLTAAIAAIRARIPLAAAALASYAPEFDSQGGVCRAAFAAIDAMLSDLV